MRYAPSLDTINEMLRVVGKDDLFSDIEQKFLLKESPLDATPLCDMEVERHIDRILSKNRHVLHFRGAGYYDHYVPAHVAEIASRQEYYTSYTPYQPEISQGMLQALYEYQSLMAEVVDMPVVNASMYDWPSALAEAALMCSRINHREKFIVPDTMSPLRRAVLTSYCQPAGIGIESVGHDLKTGMMDLDGVSDVARDACGIYMEQPSYLGFFDPGASAAADIAHDSGALFVMGVDPVSCGVVRPPGGCGADIVVGEASHMGNPVSFGGPQLGIFATRDGRDFMRMMPGRVVGRTTDADGDSGYVLALQTREQHIRRERATSNICTNQSLCAVACGAYMASLGPKGLRELASLLMSNAEYACRAIDSVDGFHAPTYDARHFREFCVLSEHPVAEVESMLNSHEVSGGVALGKFESLFCITDKHSKRDIDILCELLGGMS